MSRAVDYSLYLVTDSTPAILGGADLCDVVRKALRGGVTVVQYRDKTSYTGVMVDTARKLHAVTREFGVPLLINDRVDVALTVGCEGVHIGQDDMGKTSQPRSCEECLVADCDARHPDCPQRARPERHHRRHGEHARGSSRGMQGRRRLCRPGHRLCHIDVSSGERDPPPPVSVP